MRRAWEEQKQGQWHEGDNGGTAVPRLISLTGAPGKPGLQGHRGSPPFHNFPFVQLHYLFSKVLFGYHEMLTINSQKQKALGFSRSEDIEHKAPLFAGSNFSAEHLG